MPLGVSGCGCPRGRAVRPHHLLIGGFAKTTTGCERRSLNFNRTEFPTASVRAESLRTPPIPANPPPVSRQLSVTCSGEALGKALGKALIGREKVTDTPLSILPELSRWTLPPTLASGGAPGSWDACRRVYATLVTLH